MKPALLLIIVLLMSSCVSIKINTDDGFNFFNKDFNVTLTTNGIRPITEHKNIDLKLDTCKINYGKYACQKDTNLTCKQK